ncbi:hypothetical protein FBQ82_04470 [Anaerolineae bacterium CFX7]|nr:hypothetical protein [Anaerolineae bacterium CFX7]
MKMRRTWRALSGAALALGMASGVMACSATPTPPTPLIGAPTMVVAFTPSITEAPPPTLLPTVTIVAAQPTPVVIVVTATPLASPTPAATSVRAATAVRATATPAETATPFPEGVPHVLVTALRVEPTTPQANDGGTFFVTFDNRSGKDDGYNWAIEIWDTENIKRPFGLTTPQNSPMPVGVSNLTSTGWTVKGLGDCHAYRARVIARDDEDNRMAFVQPDGSILWLDFTVCP